jgi:hypothetical protein
MIFEIKTSFFHRVNREKRDVGRKFCIFAFKNAAIYLHNKNGGILDPDGLNLNTDESLLFNLKKILNYQISTWLLFLISFFFISPILVIILALAALFLLFYIIFVLYKNGKYGWITALCITIIIPTIIMVFFIQRNYTIMILLMLEVGIFFIYCAALRLTLNVWVKDIQAARLFDLQSKRDSGI